MPARLTSGRVFGTLWKLAPLFKEHGMPHARFILLEVARQVLTGELPRDQLHTLPNQSQQVYAAISIMLAEKATYLDDNGYVRGTFTDHLTTIIYGDSAIVRPSTPTTLVQASRRLKLHQSEALRAGEGAQGKRWRIKLVPPPELQTLVDHLKPTRKTKRPSLSPALMRRADNLLWSLLQENPAVTENVFRRLRDFLKPVV